MKRIIQFLILSLILCLSFSAKVYAQQKLYDEQINPMEQIDKALAQARQQGKHVICQLGGNWCVWCLRFADFITKDTAINEVVDKNYVYIHVNYPRRGSALSESTQQVVKRLGGADRFGFPCLVVLDEEGRVIHIQDSGYLEEGKGYDKEKTLRFFRLWTPAACHPKDE